MMSLTFLKESEMTWLSPDPRMFDRTKEPNGPGVLIQRS